MRKQYTLIALFLLAINSGVAATTKEEFLEGAKKAWETAHKINPEECPSLEETLKSAAQFFDYNLCPNAEQRRRAKAAERLWDAIQEETGGDVSKTTMKHIKDAANKITGQKLPEKPKQPKPSIWRRVGTFAYNMVRPSSYLNAYREMMRRSTWMESFAVLGNHHKPVIAGIATVLTGTALGGAYAWYRYKKNKKASKEEEEN